MSTREKLIKKFLNKPTEVSFSDVVSVLVAFGYEERNSGSGSHRVFTKPGQLPVTVPTVKGRNVKGHYIQRIVELLELEEWDDSK